MSGRYTSTPAFSGVRECPRSTAILRAGSWSRSSRWWNFSTVRPPLDDFGHLDSTTLSESTHERHTASSSKGLAANFRLHPAAVRPPVNRGVDVGAPDDDGHQ